MTTGRKKAYTPGLTQLCARAWNDTEAESTPDEDLIRATMSELVGLVRNESGLAEALDRLSGIAFGRQPAQSVQEVNNKLINARLIAGSAMNRLESRGAHFRSDYPGKNDSQWKKRLVACYDLSDRRVRYATAEIGGTRETRP